MTGIWKILLSRSRGLGFDLDDIARVVELSKRFLGGVDEVEESVLVHLLPV